MAADPPCRDALWQPGRDSATTKLLLIARPGDAVRDAIDRTLAEYRISGSLGLDAFPSTNWHQSLSDRYIDTPELRRTLARAGAMVQTPAFTLEMDRIHCARNLHGSFQWDVRQRRKSEELVALVAAINTAIAACGLPRGGGHSPHVTVHYRAPGSLLRDEHIVPIRWTIDTVELVTGGGHPYRYETLDRWLLQPELPQPRQATMF